MLASTHEKKTWVTDSLSVQNPYGKSWAKGKIATMEPLTVRRSSCEKYSMYLKSMNRPKTTPFNTSAMPSQGSLRLYVNHAGDDVGNGWSRGTKSPAHINKINPKVASDWIKPPGTAPVQAKGPIRFQQHYGNPGSIRHGGSESTFGTVLSSININQERNKTGGNRKWMSDSYTKGNVGSKGHALQNSPYKQGDLLQLSSDRKSKRVMSPKKEISQHKLLREVKRSKEFAKEFRPGTTVMATRKSVSSTGSSIYLSQRLGNIMTTSSPFSSLSNRPGESNRDVGQVTSTNRQLTPSSIMGASNRISTNSHGGLGAVENSSGTSAHPLHRTTVASTQQATSRASYSHQLSTVQTGKGHSYLVGPSIVNPEFDGDGIEVPTTSGREHCFRGGMLQRSNHARHHGQHAGMKKAPPEAPGGPFGTLDLSSIPVAGDPPSLGQKWSDAKEPPRVKGWKFGQAKSHSFGETTRSEGQDSDRSDLKVGGKGAETTRLHNEGETSAAEDMIHDLLSACPVTPEPKVEQAISSTTSSNSGIDDGADSDQEVSTRSRDQDRFENGFRVLRGDYEVEKVVGEGAYGVVMKCRVLDQPGTYVAIKEFKLEDDDPDAEEVKKTMHREVKLLHDLQHRHVVQFIDHFKIAEKVFIVMEFVPMNLLEVLEEKAGCGLDKDMIRRVIFEVVSAIAFIHSKGVVYRDIKPENMLITKEGEVKLCDFGFARYVNREDDLLTDYVATRWYRAPELLLGPPFTKGGSKVQCPYGKPVDMWAIGCLMGELLDGEPLFAGDSDIDQLYRIQQILGKLMDSHAEIFEGNPSNQGIVFNVKKPTSLEARYHEKADADELDFMEGLLDMDPEKRRTSEECLQHQYLLPLAKKYSS